MGMTGSSEMTSYSLRRRDGMASVELPDGGLLPLIHIIGIGRNYAEHAAEQGADVPTRPMIFTKNPASVILDGETIVIPPICTDADWTEAALDGDHEQVDYEGELAVIIGRAVRDIDEDDVLGPDGPILGYTCSNDVSARWWQRHGSGGQFCRGKSFDTFCPLGPKVIASAAIGDPQRLRITTRVSGEVLQEDSTASMIFSVSRLVSDLSRATTLLPGTLILTGTPSGVGMARKPARFLRHGDVVEIEIAGIGTLRNTVQGGICDPDRVARAPRGR